jgi:hypothetical protein
MSLKNIYKIKEENQNEDIRIFDAMKDAALSNYIPEILS